MTTGGYYDVKPNTNSSCGPEGSGYSIPELPYPIHSFKLDTAEIFSDHRKPYYSTPTYARGSSAPFYSTSESKQDMTDHNIYQAPTPTRKILSQPYNMSQENENVQAPLLYGHFDNLEGDGNFEADGKYFENVPQTIATEFYQIHSNQVTELTCVICTHLTSGHDINSICKNSRILLKDMKPFHSSLRITDEIIFGRRLSDVHVLMREPHVSGQQFILKFRNQSERYQMIIHNHGNQTIKLCGSSRKYVLDRGLSYAFNSGDDVWLTINGIDDVMWRITVNGDIRDVEKCPNVSFQNIYYNPSLY